MCNIYKNEHYWVIGSNTSKVSAPLVGQPCQCGSVRWQARPTKDALDVTCRECGKVYSHYTGCSLAKELPRRHASNLSRQKEKQMELERILDEARKSIQQQGYDADMIIVIPGVFGKFTTHLFEGGPVGKVASETEKGSAVAFKASHVVAALFLLTPRQSTRR